MEKLTRKELINEIKELRNRITDYENKEIETEIKKYKVIVESAHDSIFYKDLESRYVIANSEKLKSFGMTHEEVIGKTDLELMPNKAEAKKIIEADREVFRTGKPNLITKHMTNGNGTEYWFEAIKVPHYNKQGNLVGLIGIARDITKRKQAEIALQKSEEKYRNLVEQMNEGIATVDENENFILINNAAARIFGYTKDEILKKNLKELTTEKEFQRILEQTNIRKTGKSSRYEINIIRKDGDSRILYVNASPIIDKKGRHKGAYGIFADITKRKQAEIALSQSEEKFRVLVENMSDFVFQIDPELRVIALNKAAKAFINRKSENIIGKKVSDLFPPQIAEIYEKSLQNVIDTSQQLVKDSILQIGHSKIFINTRLNPLLDKTGKVKAVIGVSRDITERKKLEEEIKEAAERYHGLSEAAFEAIFLSEKGVCIEQNSAAEKMFGYTLSEAVGRYGTEWIIPEDRKTVMNNMLSEFEEPYEVTALCKDGTTFPCEIQAKMMHYKGRTVRVTALKDISKRKNAELALHQYTIQLQERNEELDAFSHTVAHDLKNPMGIIMGFAELLFENYSELSKDEKLNYLKIIIDDSKKTQQIINSLLLFANLRKSDIRLSKLNMGNIVDETIKRLKPIIKSSNAEIILPEVWPVVIGYTPWIEEVWINYISNAIKYGGTPPVLEIGTDSGNGKNIPEGMVRFWLRDNGPGISAENQKRLFKKFERLDQVKTEGHGLGLSIVHRIIEKLGGEVGVESDSGSLFHFTLPSIKKR